MSDLSALAKVLVAASATLILTSLPACSGGDGSSSGASSDWYYHWNCNGDPECIALTEPGQAGLDGPSGTKNEGPVYANCSALLKFASINWNIPPATNSCDHSPTEVGAGGAGVGGGGGA